MHVGNAYQHLASDLVSCHSMSRHCVPVAVYAGAQTLHETAEMPAPTPTYKPTREQTQGQSSQQNDCFLPTGFTGRLPQRPFPTALLDESCRLKAHTHTRARTHTHTHTHRHNRETRCCVPLSRPMRVPENVLVSRLGVASQLCILDPCTTPGQFLHEAAGTPPPLPWTFRYAPPANKFVDSVPRRRPKHAFLAQRLRERGSLDTCRGPYFQLCRLGCTMNVDNIHLRCVPVSRCGVPASRPGVAAARPSTASRYRVPVVPRKLL
jgi:hypothetical protein